MEKPESDWVKISICHILPNNLGQHNTSVAQFLHLHNRDSNNTYVIGLVWIFNELISNSLDIWQNTWQRVSTQYSHHYHHHFKLTSKEINLFQAKALTLTLI